MIFEAKIKIINNIGNEYTILWERDDTLGNSVRSWAITNCIG